MRPSIRALHRALVASRGSHVSIVPRIRLFSRVSHRVSQSEDPNEDSPAPRGYASAAALETRRLARAGACVAAAVSWAGPFLLSGPGDPMGVVCLGAGLVGLPALLFYCRHIATVSPPPRAIPLALLGGALSGCFTAPFAWDITAFAAPLVPAYTAAVLLPGLVGAEIGTRFAEATADSEEAFRRAVSALEVILVAGVVVACTKAAIDRTAPPVRSDATTAALQQAGLSAAMSCTSAAWWAVFIRYPAAAGGTSPLAAAVFVLLVCASPAKEVARAFVHLFQVPQRGVAKASEGPVASAKQ